MGGDPGDASHVDRREAIARLEPAEFALDGGSSPIQVRQRSVRAG